MGEIKKVLAHWDAHKVEFDPKLVARKETGCCYPPPMDGTRTADTCDGPKQ